MNSNKPISLLLLALLFSLSACSSGEKAEVLSQQVKEAISDADSSRSFNGVVGLLGMTKEPVIIFQGYESPDLKTSKLDEEDYFYLASNSKLFTGMAALKMMEDHNLSYDAKIAPYFPELHPSLGQVTIQLLANHTSAIHDFLSLVDEPVGITNQEALQLLSRLDSTVYEPGTKWGYTNSGYMLLSLLVERVTEIPYNKYLTQEILEPLGITNAQLHPNEIDALGGFINGKPVEMPSVTTGGSGIYLTTNDLISFFENQDKLSHYVEKAEQWSSPWVDEDWRYGFGWFFSEDSLGTFIAHSGRSGGFESYFRIYEDNELMMFILTNHTNGTSRAVREEIIEVLLKAN